MNRGEFQSLIQDVLDGVASPADRRRLDEWLAGRPAEREHHARMAGLFKALESVRPADPPVDLRERVTRALGGGSAAGRERWPATGVWTAWFGRRPALALALPFAAGLAAGALAIGAWFGAFAPGFQTSADLSGSMAPPTSGAGVRHWSLGATRLVARTWARGSDTWVRLQAHDARGLEVELRFESAGRAVAEVVQTPPATGSWSLGPGRLTWLPGAGGTLLVRSTGLDPATLPLRIVLRSPEGEREEVLTPAPAGASR